MTSITMLEKPHAVIIPAPSQGHINPMLKLAKLLHHKGFHITFVNTEFNHNRLLKSRGPETLDGLPSFRFESIPDGLLPSDADATQDIPTLCESVDKHCVDPFRELLAKLNTSSSSNVPPVSCIVSDSNMTFTLTAAEELGIPEVFFWTASASGYLAYIHFLKLIEKGLTPLKDASTLTNGHLDTVLDWIPGLEGMRLRDLPTFLRTSNPDDFMLKFIVQETGRAREGSALILNTFEALEHDTIKVLSSFFPAIYTIGPLQFLENQVDDKSLEVLGSNLWKEELECLEWLDSKKANSVLYVNFGSITILTPDQLVEFAWGLANSKQNFLWIVRPDLVSGNSAILPPEVVEETKERGLFASWCPQEEVLNHPSVGGFLTHSGWNSTLESICNGLPMICWPFFAEQPTNCWFCCNQWGIGMEINSEVKRDEVEIVVRELMVGEKGKEMRKKAMEWKKLAEEAAYSSSGSSSMNLESLIHQALLPKHY